MITYRKSGIYLKKRSKDRLKVSNNKILSSLHLWKWLAKFLRYRAQPFNLGPMNNLNIIFDNPFDKVGLRDLNSYIMTLSWKWTELTLGQVGVELGTAQSQFNLLLVKWLYSKYCYKKLSIINIICVWKMYKKQ